MRRDIKPGYWIRKYHVKEKSVGWGVFVIDSEGFLGIVSDYGNYSFHWYSFGDDFVKFLISIDTGYYLTSKLGKRDHLRSDIEDQIKKEVLRLRRAKELTKAQAQEELALVDRSSFDNQFGLYEWHNETSLNVYDDWLTTNDYSASLIQMGERLWPLFVAELKADQEKAA